MKKIVALLLPVAALSLASCSDLTISGTKGDTIDSKANEDTIVNIGESYLKVAESNTIAYQMTTGLAALSSTQTLPTVSMRHSSNKTELLDEEAPVENDDTIIDASGEDNFGVDYPNYKDDKDYDHDFGRDWWDYGHWNNPWDNNHGWGHGKDNVSDMTDDQVNQVISVLPSVDLLIDEGVSINYVLNESDRADYSVKQTVNIVVSSASVDTTLVLYYNVTRSMNSSMVDNERGYELTEAKTSYKGVAVISEDVEYEFSGSSETSHKAYNNHVEDENELKLQIKTDDYSYVEIEQSEEVEDGFKSSEYSYKVVQNRKTVKSYSFESDEEDNEVEISVKLDGVKYKLSTEVIDSQTYYKVSIKDENKTKATFVRVTTENEDGTVSISYELVENQE